MLVSTTASTTVDPEVIPPGEVPMDGEERWQEIHRRSPACTARRPSGLP
jgi:hypothetical protein